MDQHNLENLENKVITADTPHGKQVFKITTVKPLKVTKSDPYTHKITYELLEGKPQGSPLYLRRVLENYLGCDANCLGGTILLLPPGFWANQDKEIKATYYKEPVYNDYLQYDVDLTILRSEAYTFIGITDGCNIPNRSSFLYKLECKKEGYEAKHRTYTTLEYTIEGESQKRQAKAVNLLTEYPDFVIKHEGVVLHVKHCNDGFRTARIGQITYGDYKVPVDDGLLVAVHEESTP